MNKKCFIKITLKIDLLEHLFSNILFYKSFIKIY